MAFDIFSDFQSLCLKTAQITELFFFFKIYSVILRWDIITWKKLLRLLTLLVLFFCLPSSCIQIQTGMDFKMVWICLLSIEGTWQRSEIWNYGITHVVQNFLCWSGSDTPGIDTLILGRGHGSDTFILGSRSRSDTLILGRRRGKKKMQKLHNDPRQWAEE